MIWRKFVLRRRKLIFYLLTTCVFIILYATYKTSLLMFSKTTQISQKFLIQTPGCKILDFDPYDSSIVKFVTKPSATLDCAQHKWPLVYVKNHWLHCNVTAAMTSHRVNSSTQVDCEYKKFERINSDPKNYTKTADSEYRYVGSWIPFQDQILISESEEYVYARCKINATTMYENAYVLISTSKESVKQKLLRKSWSKKSISSAPLHRPLSVLLIGVDSVSRLQYKRGFTKTDKILKENGAIELDGYVKVGSNTFPNIVAQLTGYSEEQLIQLCWPNYNHKFDDCPFIWKNFSERDYVTSKGEDAPRIGNFNYLKTGFVEQPTDYYMRPYIQVAQNELHSKKTMCYGDQSPTTRVLDQAQQFALTFNSTVPYFGHYWTTTLTHGSISSSYQADEPHFMFFQKLFENPETLNNTVLFFYSDHGIRYGEIRETYIGWFEECMPFFTIWLPPWFRQMYPSAMDKLKENVKRLTTPFDIHQTLRQVFR